MNRAQGFIKFLFWTYRDCRNLDLRRRLKQGEFWLIRADECIASDVLIPMRRRIIDSGRPVVLADSYENMVKPGAVFFLRSTPELSEEACRILHGTWEDIPNTLRQKLLTEYGLT